VLTVLKKAPERKRKRITKAAAAPAPVIENITTPESDIETASEPKSKRGRKPKLQRRKSIVI
jgi:hypothetical protein